MCVCVWGGESIFFTLVGDKRGVTFFFLLSCASIFFSLFNFFSVVDVSARFFILILNLFNPFANVKFPFASKLVQGGCLRSHRP